MPPALVERLPPIWQLPSAASESGNSRPASSAARCTLASTQPASTVIVSLRRSRPRTRFILASASTISRRFPVGTEPPERPVLPPCGTIASSCSAQSATTRATSAVLPGRTTHSADPEYWRRQSVKYARGSCGSVRTLAAPTMSPKSLLIIDRRDSLMVSRAKEVAPKRFRESAGRYYEDFEIGHVYEHRPGRTLSEADNTWFSLLTMNQHPLHIDAVYGAGTEFKRPLVNSALTLAIVTGMSVSDVSQKTEANLRWDKVRLTAPVFAGDTIYPEAAGLRRPAS